MESIGELAVKLKGGAGRWEKEIFNRACSFAQEVGKALPENIDEDNDEREGQKPGSKISRGAPDNHSLR